MKQLQKLNSCLSNCFVSQEKPCHSPVSILLCRQWWDESPSAPSSTMAVPCWDDRLAVRQTASTAISLTGNRLLPCPEKHGALGRDSLPARRKRFFFACTWKSLECLHISQISKENHDLRLAWSLELVPYFCSLFSDFLRLQHTFWLRRLNQREDCAVQ